MIFCIKVLVNKCCGLSFLNVVTLLVNLYIPHISNLELLLLLVILFHFKMIPSLSVITMWKRAMDSSFGTFDSCLNIPSISIISTKGQMPQNNKK